MFCIAAATAFAGCTAQSQDTVTADTTHGKVIEKSVPFDPNTASVSSKTVTLYTFSTQDPENTTLYFVNGGEIPYASLEEYMDHLDPELHSPARIRSPVHRLVYRQKIQG